MQVEMAAHGDVVPDDGTDEILVRRAPAVENEFLLRGINSPCKLSITCERNFRARSCWQTIVSEARGHAAIIGDPAHHRVNRGRVVHLQVCAIDNFYDIGTAKLNPPG